MASLANLQKRYDRSLENADYYAAEQACRMMHHRLTQNKNKTDQDMDKALSILLNGSETLLTKKQAQAGTALGLLAMKHAVQHKVPVKEEMVSSALKIAELFDTSEENSDEVLREKLRFLKAALEWSAHKDCGGFENGHASLNAATAHCAAEAADFDLAQKLFVRSDDPEGCGNFLFTYAIQETLPSEHGLVLTRTIARYLLTDNIKDAIIVRKTFSELAGWGSVEEGGDADNIPPLGNFCEILVRLCQLERTASPLFETVCKAYEGELSRDENVSTMVKNIGLMYFDIKPPQPTGMAGMMNSMLRGLMGN